ncbi:MAG TPA: hypothetical protein VFZ09_21990 [Archangium sp.]|nr:hypothetical protein [Archangium sp.]HEX5748927.1 hypothetical protein [Archangium sp.]
MSRLTSPTPPTALPSTAIASQRRKWLTGRPPSSTAASTSELPAIECAKWPAPTMNVKNPMSDSCPNVLWLADTSHATSAMSHPPITAPQNSSPLPRSAASLPSATSFSMTPCFTAPVRLTHSVKRNAPTRLHPSTTAHSRNNRVSLAGSRSTTTTGKSVFSVKSCARPTMTAMKPAG